MGFGASTLYLLGHVIESVGEAMEGTSMTDMSAQQRTLEPLNPPALTEIKCTVVGALS